MAVGDGRGPGGRGALSVRGRRRGKGRMIQCRQGKGGPYYAPRILKEKEGPGKDARINH